MPKFNLTLDSQQLYEFGVCPLSWYYKYKENLRLALPGQKVAADKGTLVHALMDLYYTLRAEDANGNMITQAGYAIEQFKKNKITESLFPDDPLANNELEDFICNRFMLYIYRYLLDDFKVLNYNGKPGVEVGFSNILFEDQNVRFILEGRVDLLNMLMQETPCWVDHKTEGKYNPLYLYKTQFRTYALATEFEYGMVNYFGMQEDKKQELLRSNKLFRRELIHFPKEMIQEWKQKVIRMFWNIYYGLNDKVPETMFHEMKNESSCSGAFDSHPCQFTHLCEEYNWDFKQKQKEFKYKKVEPWIPWKPEEINK